WLIMPKDVCTTLVVTTAIILTVVGSLNQAKCWLSCDKSLLLLPEMTQDTLQSRLTQEYPAIIFTTFGLLVALSTILACILWDGISVYLQRDDSKGLFGLSL